MAAPERSGCTVLVADDDALVRSVLRMALVSRGHDVIEACDAPGASTAAHQAHDLHLVVLDLNMPGGPVSQTLAALRDRHPGVPVLVLSGALELPDDVAATEVEFARKPVELDAFLSSVSRLLEVGSASVAASTES